MKPRVKKIDEMVKNYDSRLFATERSDGCVIIWRRAERWGVLTDSSNPDLARFIPQPIIALTDDWTLKGRPVERGLTPLYFRLSEMDSHRDDGILDEIEKERKIFEQNKEHERRNNFRAYAADHRREFARAFSDINTSTL